MIPLDVTGDCPVSCSSTFVARVNLSPLSPTLMLMQSFSIFNFFMGLIFSSFFAGALPLVSFLGAGVAYTIDGFKDITDHMKLKSDSIPILPNKGKYM